MPIRFSALASGSSGNASLLEVNGSGLLIDVGLGPRQLASRLREVGSSWNNINAVVLTHTHGDHWKPRTFSQMQRLGIPLYCHPAHYGSLQLGTSQIVALKNAGLVHFYCEQEFLPISGLRCLPLPVRHDGGPTFGFRFDGGADLFGQPLAVGYVADLGCWDTGLVQSLVDVDLLALEFNHDSHLERSSGRSLQLIRRVLGDHGHLSNVQAGDLLRKVLGHSTPGRLRHVVQLHLSRDCNRPELARESIRAVLAEVSHRVEIHTARQEQPGPSLTIGATDSFYFAAKRPRSSSRQRTFSRASSSAQPFFPGWEE